MALRWATMLLLAACAPTVPPVQVVSTGTGPLRGELVVDGLLQERLAAPDGAELVVLYGGEEKGSLETCGCPKRPRGSVARQAAYASAVRDAQPSVPVVQVNGGYWLEDAMSLDGTTRPDVPVLNRWMVAGLLDLAPSALNVSYNDMAGITSLGGPELVASEGLPLVSANLRGPGVAQTRRLELGELTVGITGISTPGVTFLPTPGFEVLSPVTAGKAVLAELRDTVDVVILLAYGAPEAARKLAETGLVDVVVDTNLHRDRSAPFRVGEAVWVRSHFQTMRLGELRLELDLDGSGPRVTGALDRKIDLDPGVPDHPDAATIRDAARVEIGAAQKALFSGG